MKNIIKRFIHFIFRVFRRIMFGRSGPKVARVYDNGENNIFSIGGNCAGKIKIKFSGANNIVHIAENCKFYGGGDCVFISGNGNEVTIGRNTTFDQNVLIVACEGTNITIDEDCMFAANVTLRSSDQHPIYDNKGERINHARNIYIGKHVWLGAKSVIMKGVSVGSGSMVAYGALVTKNLPEKCLAVGAPARVVKENIVWDRNFKK